MKLTKITPISALKRRSSAPQLVVVAPSGSGKSTLVYLLLNRRLIPYMKIGIGDKNQTTIIPCEFCIDDRIEEEDTFAIQIIKKDYTSKDIHRVVLTVLMELFAKTDYDLKEAIDDFNENAWEKVVEPEGAMYHLGEIRDAISLNELKKALNPILDYMIENNFNELVKERRKELKTKKVKIAEVGELIFDEIFDKIEEPKENEKNDIAKEKAYKAKEIYINWLNKIGDVISNNLSKVIGEDLFNQKMVSYNLKGNGPLVLSTLFSPKAPYSLIIDHICIASKPRQELIDIAQKTSPDLPFRFCIRDTMGLTQKGVDSTSTKEALEVALNCKADTILFLMSLEERDDVLAECCRALADKKQELEKKYLDVSVHVLFTKADRFVENLICKREGELYINEKTYKDNIEGALETIEKKVAEYSQRIPQKEVSWLSMRYVEDSYLLISLENDKRINSFKPEGLFKKIVDISMDTLRNKLPKNVSNPIFVTAKDPDMPAIKVSIDLQKINKEIVTIRYNLCKNKSVVNGYVISEKTPLIHGRSVNAYWHNLTIGLGHTTHASVYGNFSINMKGLLKRLLYYVFESFKIFDMKGAINFNADNLEDKEVIEVTKNLLNSDNIDTAGLNLALGQKNIALQRLYEFYREFFNEKNYAIVIDRVAYNLSYNNEQLKQALNKIYNNNNYGYDTTMRELQKFFYRFFNSNVFEKILIEELNQAMTDMVNKTFIVI